MKIVTERKFTGIYRGTVVDNNDPLKLGRIKVKVYPWFANITESNKLPWAVPAMPIWEGSGNGYGYFAVPKVGSQVFVFFENGEYMQPVYFAEALDGVYGLPAERETNYPDRKVMKTKNGIVIYVDDNAKEIYIYHPSSTYLKIDSDGNISVHASGNIGVNASGDITIEGATVNINP